ncbi:MAG: hypothetical protein JST06_11775 [Bacteroidetes bacterium]|nr:hypothetical protein [Bacteroidota bacterium]
MVQSLISADIFTVGSDIYIDQMLQALSDSMSQQSFDVGISGLQSVLATLISNPDLINTGITGVASIAYSSAVFWNQVQVSAGTESTSFMSWFHIKLPTWVVTVCKDIAGALAAGEAGATIGGLLGPIGAGVGLGIGLVAGGVAGSES